MHSSTRAVRGLPRRSRAGEGGCCSSASPWPRRPGLAQRASQAQQPQPYTKWDQYGGSSDSMQYSALAQINKTNVKQLQRAWFYPVPGEPDRLVFNPLIVDNVMYVSGVGGVIVALDATTGKELWMSTLRATERGLAYWESKDRSDRRLILTANNGIREVDARTGQQIMTFGTNGFVDMRVGTPRRNGGPNSSPGRVFENLIIVGSNVGEGYGSPPGDIRAYDVLTGKLVWTFHTIPRPGEYGYETWPEDAFRYAGGANTWGDLTLDEKNGIVFLPTGSPTHDLYGGDRQGDNLFGNCLLALDARTGKRLWHFQIVHHDLWDYDNAAAPKLLTVQSQRQADRHRRAGGQDRISLRLRTKDRNAAMADRRAARAEERRARRVFVADAADSDQAAAVRAAVDDARRSESVRQPRRAGKAEAARARSGERRGVHAVEPSAPAHPVSRRVGRRELGQHGRRSADRHGLRAQPRDDQLPQDVARRAVARRRRRRWRPRTGRRAARAARAGGAERLHAALRRLPRPRADADALDEGAWVGGIPFDRAQRRQLDAAVSRRPRSRTTRSERSSRI